MKIVSRFVVLAIAGVCPVIASAQAVELKSKDGFINIEGVIEDFDGSILTVETAYGVIKIPANEVTCSGDCPEGTTLTEVASDGLAIGADAEMAATLSSILGNPSIAALADTTITVDGARLTIGDGDEGIDLNFAPTGSRRDMRLVLTGMTATATAGQPTVIEDIAQSNVYEIATMPLAVSLGQNTGVSTLGQDDLARIFAGSYTNWQELGGDDQPIRLFAGVGDTGDLDRLQATVLDPYGLTASAQIYRLHEDEFLADFIAKAPGGIGISSLTSVDANQAVPIENACGMPVRPSEFSVGAGEYPLVATLYLDGTGSEIPSNVSRTLDALALPQAAPVLAHAGLTPLSIVTEPSENKNDRIARIMSFDWTETQREAAREMVTDLFVAHRLSMDFSTTATTPAQSARMHADFIRLAEAIKAGDFDGQEIYFVGYSNLDDAAASIEQATSAAQTIMSAFAAFAPEAAARQQTGFTAMGYGNVGFACVPDTAPNTELVEVWVRPQAESN